MGKVHRLTSLDDRYIRLKSLDNLGNPFADHPASKDRITHIPVYRKIAGQLKLGQKSIPQPQVTSRFQPSKHCTRNS